MRVFAYIVGIVAGFAGVGAACAADLPHVAVSSGTALYYAPHGVRAGQVWIWAYEPGVAARPYWLAPWRDRHYFPFTGHRPHIGRRENTRLRARTAPPGSYTRTWTTTSAFLVERPRFRDDGGGPLPPEPPLK